MNRYQQPLLDDEPEDMSYQDEEDVPGVNHSGTRAISVVAYFALLAVLMYPAQKLNMKTQGVFFTMVAAGLLLGLGLLLVKWVRRQLTSLHLSKRGVVQLLVGYQPETLQDREAQPETPMSVWETGAIPGARPSPAPTRHAGTSLVPLGDRPMVRSGEVVDDDGLDEGEAEDELPASIIETNPLYLASTFQPDANSLMGATALLCGMRRTGKSNGIAVIAEELARYYCPLCIGDTEDEYGPLADPHYLPRGLWAGSAALSHEMHARGVTNYVTVDEQSAYGFGQAIVRDVLQVVLHLKSFETDVDAALVMSEIMQGMHDWEASQPNSRRVPCTFILDEASKWIPQRLEESCLLDKEVLYLLHQALFGVMVRRGGKQGLGLILATQRIAEVDKRALQSQWKLLFKQTEAVDLALYSRLGLPREEVMSLRQGECFIYSPSVIGFRTTLRARYSPHLAHTPGLPQLASHLRSVRPLEQVARPYASVEASPVAPPPDGYVPAFPQSAPAPKAEPVTPPRAKPKTDLERGVEAYLEGATSQPKLAAALKISPWEARKLMPEVEAEVRQREQEES